MNQPVTSLTIKSCEKIPEIEFCLKISYTEIIIEGLIIGCNFTAAQSLE